MERCHVSISFYLQFVSVDGYDHKMAESVNVITADDVSGGIQIIKKKIEKTIAIAPKPQAVFPRPLLVIGLDQKFLTTDQKSQTLFKKKPNEAPVSQIIFPQAQLTGVKPTVFVGFENNFLHSAFAVSMNDNF